MQRFYKAAGYLSRRVYTALRAADQPFLKDVCEVRLRAEKPLALITFHGTYYMTNSGRITSLPAGDIFAVSTNDIKESFSRICDYSVYSFAKDIRAGFVTVGGGSRAGIYGTAVYENEAITAVRNVSGINLRIAREYRGCAAQLVRHVSEGGLCGFLLCGAPATGKTTMLRDAAAQISDKLMKKIVIVDERGEIAATAKGVAQNHVGINTDVLDGYRKADGILQAIRTLSPDLIICDELGGEADCRAVRTGLNAGAAFAASVHAGSREELMRKKEILALCESGAFGKLIFLKSGVPCEIAEVLPAEALFA